MNPAVSCFPRQYYEMLYNTADELLNLVVDQGVKYTELEYIHALTLLHRSQTGVGDQTTQNMRLQRLKEIICEQAAIKQATKDKKITTVWTGCMAGRGQGMGHFCFLSHSPFFGMLVAMFWADWVFSTLKLGWKEGVRLLFFFFLAFL